MPKAENTAMIENTELSLRAQNAMQIADSREELSEVVNLFAPYVVHKMSIDEVFVVIFDDGSMLAFRPDPKTNTDQIAAIPKDAKAARIILEVAVKDITRKIKDH
jgi:hypothetical protein